MKWTYFGNFKSNIPAIDRDILFSLEKKGKVKTFDIVDTIKFDEEQILKIAEESNKGDVFLFHGFIPMQDEMLLGLVLERFNVLLSQIKCKRVMWMMDKVMGKEVKIIMTLEKNLDAIFVTDETWLRRFDSDKIFPLHPAASENVYIGNKTDELTCDIAFAGSLYGERVGMYESLKRKFGDRFRVYDDKFGQSYADLCKSARIIFVPQIPFDDFFWSDRIYTILQNGGFCLHPRTYGLQEEGFVDGRHYMTYHTEQDMFVTARMLLDQSSDKLIEGISKEGKEFVKEHTYSKRIDEMLTKI